MWAAAIRPKLQSRYRVVSFSTYGSAMPTNGLRSRKTACCCAQFENAVDGRGLDASGPDPRGLALLGAVEAAVLTGSRPSRGARA